MYARKPILGNLAASKQEQRGPGKKDAVTCQSSNQLSVVVKPSTIIHTSSLGRHADNIDDHFSAFVVTHCEKHD